MSYSVQNIRNVCLLGHSGSGKTTLAENLLLMTGAIERMGRVADGNTVCDYDPEEVKRQISLSTAVAPIEYKGCRINVLDTPGAFDFSGEVMEALRAADAAIIVCSAKDGVSVGMEKAWKYCEERNMPRLLYISKTDEDNSDYNTTFEALRERFGKKVAPVVVPIWDENKRVTGLIDVLNKRAYEMQGGKRVEIEVPEDKASVIEEFNDALKESVAETSEEFMERFFNGEAFTYAEMAQGLRAGVRELSIFPVLCGSAVAGMGTLMLLDNIVELLPSPEQGNYHKATLADGSTEEFVVSAGGVPAAFVFKTLSDQYGKYSFVKVLSGSITPDMTLVNARTGETEKLGRLYTMRGKKATEVKELVCGDIGAIGKMERVKTGDTLCDSRKVVALKGIPFAEPCYSVAIAPKTRGQDDKVAQGLARLNEEDPSFTVVNNAETHQMVLSAAGAMQVVSGLLELDVPLILDADALNCLSKIAIDGIDSNPEMYRREQPLVMTPHYRELSRLVAGDEVNDLGTAIAAAQKVVWAAGSDNLVVIAKGPTTAICGVERVLLPLSGPASLATAGSGDVLAGILAGTLATMRDDMDRWELLYSYAVALHSYAGFAAATEYGEKSVIATDLIDLIGPAMELAAKDALEDLGIMDEGSDD